MIFIGERLNSSIPSVKALIDGGDTAALTDIIKAQSAAGADFLDVNTALCADELASMKQLFDLIIQNSDCGIVIDTPDTSVCSSAAEYIRSKTDRQCIINSITINERHECIKIAKEYGMGLVVLLTDDGGIPDTSEKRTDNAAKAIEMLRRKGFPDEKIYIDFIVESAAASGEAASVAVSTVRELRGRYPSVHILGGLSNISFGLPKRSIINQAFMTVAAFSGMDCAICDVTSANMHKAAAAAEALNGSDDFCLEYISTFR